MRDSAEKEDRKVIPRIQIQCCVTPIWNLIQPLSAEKEQRSILTGSGWVNHILQLCRVTSEKIIQSHTLNILIVQGRNKKWATDWERKFKRLSMKWNSSVLISERFLCASSFFFFCANSVLLDKWLYRAASFTESKHTSGKWCFES